MPMSRKRAASTISRVFKRRRFNRGSQAFNSRLVPRTVSTLNNAGGLSVVKKVTTQGFVTILPTVGIALGGIATSPVIGLYFTQAGMVVYNTTVGAATSVPFTYPNSTNYTAIFDQYRIAKVRVQGYFSNNTSNVSSVTTNIPLFYTAPDFDGSNSSPTTAAGVLAYENSMVHQQGSNTDKPVIDRTIIPRVVNNLSGNLVTANNYGLMPVKSWIDCVSANTPHWGMFVGYDYQGGTQVTSIGALTFVVSVELQYRGIRG